MTYKNNFSTFPYLKTCFLNSVSADSDMASSKLELFKWCQGIVKDFILWVNNKKVGIFYLNLPLHIKIEIK